MTDQSWWQKPESRIDQNLRGSHVLYSVQAAGVFTVSNLCFI